MPDSLLIQHAAATAVGVVVELTTFCAIVGGAVLVQKDVAWVLTPRRD